jgi:hypothetical protein
MATTPKKSSQTKHTNPGDSKPKKKAAAKGSAAGKKSESATKTTEKTVPTKKAASSKKTTPGKKARPGKKPAAAKTTSKETPARSKISVKPDTTKTATKKSKTRTRKLRYKKDQEIVYPLQGVGQIRSIEERVFRSTKLLYYIIYLEVSDMTIMVPVDKADELGIRPIVDKRQANKALKLISEEYEPVPTDWKARYQNNLDPETVRQRLEASGG